MGKKRGSHLNGTVLLALATVEKKETAIILQHSCLFRTVTFQLTFLNRQVCGFDHEVYAEAK